LVLSGYGSPAHDTNRSCDLTLEAEKDQALELESDGHSFELADFVDSSSSEDEDEEMAKLKAASEAGKMTGTNWANILILGGGFLLLFTAFQTTAFVQV
jgi:hypothetical protein